MNAPLFVIPGGGGGTIEVVTVTLSNGESNASTRLRTIKYSSVPITTPTPYTDKDGALVANVPASGVIHLDTGGSESDTRVVLLIGY